MCPISPHHLNKLPNVKIINGELYIAGKPLYALSTGYASIVRLFQEIVAGYGAWQSIIDSKTPLNETKGVVFIDEIEAHLHAEWQSKIIPLLKKSFPNTTFYIATHSPIIVATTEQDEAYELVREDDNMIRAKKLGNPREWYMADVYEQAFHVNLSDVEEQSQIDDEDSLIDLLLTFSNTVKLYQHQKKAETKIEIDKLYTKILTRVPEGDPRRRSVKAMRELVQ